MTTKIIIEIDEDILKMLDNKIKLGSFKDKGDAINYYIKRGILVEVER